MVTGRLLAQGLAQVALRVPPGDVRRERARHALHLPRCVEVALARLDALEEDSRRALRAEGSDAGDGVCALRAAAQDVRHARHVQSAVRTGVGALLVGGEVFRVDDVVFRVQQLAVARALAERGVRICGVRWGRWNRRFDAPPHGGGGEFEPRLDQTVAVAAVDDRVERVRRSLVADDVDSRHERGEVGLYQDDIEDARRVAPCAIQSLESDRGRAEQAVCRNEVVHGDLGAEVNAAGVRGDRGLLQGCPAGDERACICAERSVQVAHDDDARARSVLAVPAGADGRGEPIDVVPGVGPHGRARGDVDADDDEHGRAAREHHRDAVKEGGAWRLVAAVEFLRAQQTGREHRRGSEQHAAAFGRSASAPERCVVWGGELRRDGLIVVVRLGEHRDRPLEFRGESLEWLAPAAARAVELLGRVPREQRHHVGHERYRREADVGDAQRVHALQPQRARFLLAPPLACVEAALPLRGPCRRAQRGVRAAGRVAVWRRGATDRR